MKSYYVTTRSGRVDIIFAASKAAANRQCHLTHCENGKVRTFDFKPFRFTANDTDAWMQLGDLGLEVWKMLDGKQHRVALFTGQASLRSLWRWIVGDNATVTVNEGCDSKIHRVLGWPRKNRQLAGVANGR